MDGFLSRPESVQPCSYAQPGRCRIEDAEASIARVASGDHLLLALAVASLIVPPCLAFCVRGETRAAFSVFSCARAFRGRLLLCKIPFSSLPVLGCFDGGLGIVDLW